MLARLLLASASRPSAVLPTPLRRILPPMFFGCAALIAALPAVAQTANSAVASSDIWHRTNHFGDLGGLRTRLGNEGISLNITDSENLLGNTLGGVKQGAGPPP